MQFVRPEENTQFFISTILNYIWNNRHSFLWNMGLLKLYDRLLMSFMVLITRKIIQNLGHEGDRLRVCNVYHLNKCKMLSQKTATHSMSIIQKHHINTESFKFNVSVHNGKMHYCYLYADQILYEFKVNSEFLTFQGDWDIFIQSLTFVLIYYMDLQLSI